MSPLATEGGVTSDAVTLFVERARSARHDFELQDPQTAAAVTEICETVDGLPLGIELAAARMAAMSAIEVRDRLADRFRLLQRGAPGPERQLTLRHAVEWSYDLLTDDERSLLRTASVFAGGFDLSSICAVVDDADEIDVLRHLDSLVRKSLVVADHSAATTRYALYETIRQFAEDRLADAGERERTRDVHAAEFGRRAVAEWERWDGPGWRDAVDWVELELGNLRAGFRWSAERGQLEVATDIAAHAALMGFSVQLFETLAWAEELLDAASTADVPRLPRLYTAAGYACFAGRPDAARRNAHRATELAADDRYDPCEPGYSTFIEALGQVYCGDLDRYIELTGEVAERYGAERGYGLASYVDGLQSAGRVEEALALTEQSVAVARRARQPVLDLVRALDRGHGLLEVRFATGTGRVGRGRRLRARAPGALLRGLPRPRRGTAAHVRRRAGGGAGAVRRCHRVLSSGRQRPAADHHARERARTVRTARAVRGGRDAARRDVTARVELPSRPRVGRSRRSARREARCQAGQGTRRRRRRLQPRRRRRCTPASRSTSPGATRGHASGRRVPVA